MRFVETAAKTIDQAIMAGLEQLGVDADQVDVEIISEGGFLKKAKVKLTVKADVQKLDVKQIFQEEKKQDKNTKPAKKEEVQKHTAKTETKVTEEKTVSNSNGEKYDVAEKFLTGLIESMGSKSKVSRNETENTVEFVVDGEDVGMLIGKSGVVMKALDYLTATIAINCRDKESKKRVNVNVGNYREKRSDILIKLAEKTAERVKASGKYIKLEPMNASERRIIHSHLQNIEGIKTFSSGAEPRRCLCIAPADK